jgi:hypothetical protein
MNQYFPRVQTDDVDDSCLSGYIVKQLKMMIVPIKDIETSKLGGA